MIMVWAHIMWEKLTKILLEIELPILFMFL